MRQRVRTPEEKGIRNDARYATPPMSARTNPGGHRMACRCTAAEGAYSLSCARAAGTQKWACRTAVGDLAMIADERSCLATVCVRGAAPVGGALGRRRRTKLPTLKNGTEDRRMLVVPRDFTHASSVTAIAPNLLTARRDVVGIATETCEPCTRSTIRRRRG
jgi:hypothetical protein